MCIVFYKLLETLLLLGDEYVRGEIEQVLHYQRQFSVAVNLAAFLLFSAIGAVRRQA